MIFAKKILLHFLLLFLSFSSLFFSTAFSNKIYARENTCSSYVDYASIPDTFFVGDPNNKFEFTLTSINTSPNSVYTLHFIDHNKIGLGTPIDSKQSAPNGNITFSTTTSEAFAKGGTYFLVLDGPGIGNILGSGCVLHEYTVDDSYSCGGYKITQIRGGQQCHGGTHQGDLCLEAGTNVGITIKNIRRGSGFYADEKVTLHKTGPGLNHFDEKRTDNQGTVTFENIPISDPDSYNILIETSLGSNICKFSFVAGDPKSCTSSNKCETDDPNLGGNYSGGTLIAQFELCGQIEDTVQRDKCVQCSDQSGVWTAIGCIGQDPTAIAESLVDLGLGIGGGIALLMILGAGFLFSVSQGSPDKLKQAKELLTAAITGLLFIIFSVMILQFIGYDLLRIPGFGI